MVVQGLCIFIGQSEGLPFSRQKSNRIFPLPKTFFLKVRVYSLQERDYKNTILVVPATSELPLISRKVKKKKNFQEGITDVSDVFRIVE